MPKQQQPNGMLGKKPLAPVDQGYGGPEDFHGWSRARVRGGTSIYDPHDQALSRSTAAATDHLAIGCIQDPGHEVARGGEAMTLILRKSSAQARTEGWDPRIWPDDDFDIVDADILVGRIYRELICGEPKWRWSIQQIPETGPGRGIAPPNHGFANTLDEAKAAFKARYTQLREKEG